MAAMLMYHHGFQFVHGAMFTVSTFFTLSRFLIATVVLGEKARTRAGVARQVLRAAGPAAAARGAGRAGRGRHDPVAVRRGLRAPVPGRRPGRPRLHDQLAAGGLGVGRGHVPGRGADPALLVAGHRGAVLPGLPVPAAGGAVPDPAPAGLAGGLLAALAAGSFAGLGQRHGQRQHRHHLLRHLQPGGRDPGRRGAGPGGGHRPASRPSPAGRGWR